MIKNKSLKVIIIIIFIVFICSYYISNSTYYEYELQRKTILTNEKIKEFENDVKNNKDIDVKEYLNTDETIYYNKITNTVYNLSDSGNKVFRKCIQLIFKKISQAIEEN